MQDSEHSFLRQAGRILNSGQSRTLILSGNIHDLFRHSGDERDEYLPLVPFLTRKWSVADRVVLVYELNGPIRFLCEKDKEKVRDAWLRWRTGMDSETFAIENMLSSGRTQAHLEMLGKTFDSNLGATIGNPTVALEFLRQLCVCSRWQRDAAPFLREDLIILIEACDTLVPEGRIPNLPDADRHRVSICEDWFADPGFMNGGDSVVLISESRSLVNHRLARLPQIIEVQVPSPDDATRREFVDWFEKGQPADRKPRLWSSHEDFVRFTAGLSIHALMQILKGACHAQRDLTLTDVIEKVEDYIQSQIGEDVVEFKRPLHSLDHVVGFQKLKGFLRKELIPRFRSMGPDALPGAAVGGPIGSGKTFIFEAVASELDMVVLVLKNIRSKWFGETDVIFERLRRVLDALSKVLIFVDEADTQFGALGRDAQATERRLTGKIQAMMSDPQLRGRVIWLLMTARIHMLSPDIRRPGRVGDLIIPVLDPEGEDLDEFLQWVVQPVLENKPSSLELEKLKAAVGSLSAASLTSLRSELLAKASLGEDGTRLSFDEVLHIVSDHLPPAITETRHYQSLQALVNCTRRSLLPDPDVSDEERAGWAAEIRSLEAQGVR